MANEAHKYAPPFESQFDPERAQEWIIWNLIRYVHTCTLVRVLAVRPAVDKVGFVDVQPMVQDVDTSGVVVQQSPIYNVPYTRYQGGASAVILDPAVGDIGLAMFAERDITTIKSTQADAPAATDRAYSSADGLYIGGVLNADPTQYVKFQPEGSGIEIVSPGDITLQAEGDISLQSGGTTTVNAPGGFVVNANMTLNGSMSGTATGAGAYQFAGTIVAPDAVINGVAQSTHKHLVVGVGVPTNGPQN